MVQGDEIKQRAHTHTAHSHTLVAHSTTKPLANTQFQFSVDIFEYSHSLNGYTEAEEEHRYHLSTQFSFVHSFCSFTQSPGRDTSTKTSAKDK